MKKLKEILKTNSSFSSNIDIGLGNSPQGDLSSVEENIKEENNQDVYYVKIDKSQTRRAVASSDTKKGQSHRFKMDQSKQQVIHIHQNEFSLGKKEQQIYSKAGAHYFIDKKHVKENDRVFQSESKRKSKLFHNEFQNLFNINKNKMNLETGIKIQKIKYDENIEDDIIHERIEIFDLPVVNKEQQALVATSEQLDLLLNSQGSLSSSVTDENSCNGEDHFELSLKVNYQTHFGQEIGIVGNIPILGQWDVAKPLKMRWTEGHYWIAENIPISEKKGDPTYFMYKYCLLQDGKFQFFEQGLDRIVDLKIANYNLQRQLS